MLQLRSTFLAVFLLIPIFENVKTDRVVMTNSGPLKGITVFSEDLEVEAFLGIPYAEPPVGELRFMKPIPKRSWFDVYDASKLPPTCIQNATEHYYYQPNDDNMTEDCLYLNIWVPYSNVDSKLKPIIIFLYGGAFNLGSSNMQLYDGTRMANRGDIIVVTLNYRVGAMGFFMSYTEEAAGNMGMYDQIMAMRWIQSNAESFGGDPNHIVLMGESAGAYAITGHLISPLTRNLFRRVIMQSGSGMHPLILDHNKRILKISHRIAVILGCAEKNITLKDHSKLVVQCLKTLPAKQISAAEGLLMKNNPITFAPRTQDAFIPKDGTEPYLDGDFLDTEMLIGVNKEEGHLFLTVAAPQYFGVYGINKVQTLSSRIAYQVIRLIFTTMGLEEAKEIADFYIKSIKNGTSDIYTKAISQSIGDLLITCGTYFQAEIHSSRNPVYFYVFSHRPESTPLAKWMETTHFDELQYIWGNPLFGNFTAEEEKISWRTMDRWIAFAKTGNPNIPGETNWPLFRYNNPEYLDIDTEEKVRLQPDGNRCRFWRTIFHTNINESMMENLRYSRIPSSSNHHAISISLLLSSIWITISFGLFAQMTSHIME